MNRRRIPKTVGSASMPSSKSARVTRPDSTHYGFDGSNLAPLLFRSRTLRYHPHMPIDMNALARAGAEARLSELQDEIAEIQRAFPGIGNTDTRRTPGRRGRPTSTPNESSPSIVRRRKRRAMSAAQRKAVGERMKKY